MTARLTLALDVMGGDQAPAVVIDGANVARERFPNVDFLMIGDESQIASLLGSFPSLRNVSHILHTDQWVAADEKPAVALRVGRQSSMRLALDAVAEGQAVAAVSAGNTGALMAMAKLALRTLPGIDRPAMAQILPSRSGETVMLDLGANVVCSAQNLVQFAIMGDAFARAVLGLVNPSIGLLNIGSEEMKGREELRQAAAILRQSPLAAQFKGFIEGNNLLSGVVDVAVADGFTGNIALKTIEGTAELLVHLLRESFKSSIWTQLAYLLMRPALSRFRNRVDPRRYNGAVFVGLNGIAVKSHGSADALGFANAIGVAVDMAMHGFLDKIREQIFALQATTEDPSLAFGVPS